MCISAAVVFGYLVFVICFLSFFFSFPLAMSLFAWVCVGMLSNTYYLYENGFHISCILSNSYFTEIYTCDKSTYTKIKENKQEKITADCLLRALHTPNIFYLFVSTLYIVYVSEAFCWFTSRYLFLFTKFLSFSHFFPSLHLM